MTEWKTVDEIIEERKNECPLCVMGIPIVSMQPKTSIVDRVKLEDLKVLLVGLENQFPAKKF